MKIPSDRIHSHFLTTLVHFISQLVHLGLAIFFTIEWHTLTSSCASLGTALTSVFGALTALYGFLSAGKGYAILTHFCDEPWAKKTLSILSSSSAVIACGALVLLEIEVSGKLSFCGITGDETPVLPSRIFLVVSALLNIIFFATSLFLHWRQGRIDAMEAALPRISVTSYPFSPSSPVTVPSAPPLSITKPLPTRLDPSARLHSPDYFVSPYPQK